jgi:hypothetical protein
MVLSDMGCTECVLFELSTPKDVPKMAFTTIIGTFVSNVLQMGDTNGPLICQCLMVHIFHKCIRRFAHVYMDDIFIFLKSIEEHEGHLLQVFTKLRDTQLYLSCKKVELYVESIECLGHLINSKGIHAELTKWPRCGSGAHPTCTMTS